MIINNYHIVRYKAVIGLLLVAFLLLIDGTSHGQNWNMIYSDELEAEEYMLDHQYQRAAKKYMDAKRQFPESYNLSFKIGYTYLLSDDMKHHALEFLEEAAQHASVDYDPQSIQETLAPIEALYFLGKAYQIAKRFDDAIKAFEKFLTMVEPDHDFRALAEQQIASSKRAPALMKAGIAVETINLGANINDDLPNFNAVISGDGQTLAFTTISRIGFDIFVSHRNADGWGKPKRITSDLRRKFLKTSSLSYDGVELILSEDMLDESDLFATIFHEGKWSKAVKLKKPINSKFNETHGATTADGNTLYFTSNRPGGLGGMDIYRTTVDERGRWSQPENLGPRVNTPLNEETPFITENNILFFSSEGHAGLGGYDVFFVDLNGNDKAANLGFPINTPDDDLFFHPESGGKSGFMAFYHPSNKGMRDIHHITIIPRVGLMGLLATGSSPVVEGETFEVMIRNNTTQEVEANLTTKFTGSEPLHMLPPGKYTVSITNPRFKNFETLVDIPKSYALPTYTFTANLSPIPAQIPQDPIAQVQEVKPDKPIVPEAEPLPQPPISKPEVKEVRREEPAPIAAKRNEPSPQREPKAQGSSPRAPSPFAGLPTTPHHGFYTVQFIALNRPVPPARFGDVNNLVIITGNDGFVRYSSGMVSSTEEANAIKTQLQQSGYTDAFTRPLPLEGQFTIQIMALASPTSIRAFEGVSNLIVRQGADGIFRFSTGSYASFNEARENLQSVVDMGFKDAFVQRIAP